jgi:hypothetical protein
MTPGFQSKDFEVRTSDGLNFYLLVDVIYVAQNGTIIKIPAGTYSNGASSPREVWPAIPPFGIYWRAAFLHDGAYDNMLQAQMPDGTFAKFTLVKEQCDALLREAMLSLGVTESQAQLIFVAVDRFGQVYFDESRRQINGQTPT